MYKKKYFCSDRINTTTAHPYKKPSIRQFPQHFAPRFPNNDEDNEKVSSDEKNKRMGIFISYASVDLTRFRIPEIATTLEMFPRIDRVYYWDRDSDSQASIISYMEKSIKNSEVLIVISTEASLDSEPVNQEIDMAVYQKKRIIPVFREIKYVRDILGPRRGLKFETNNFSLFIDQLYRIIT